MSLHSKIIFISMFSVSMLSGMQQNSPKSAFIEKTEPVETKHTYKKAFFVGQQERASLQYSMIYKNHMLSSAEICFIMEESEYGGCRNHYTNLTKLLLIRTIRQINLINDFKIEIRAFSDRDLNQILCQLGCEPYLWRGSSLDWGYLISNHETLEKLKRMQEDIEKEVITQ